MVRYMVTNDDNDNLGKFKTVKEAKVRIKELKELYVLVYKKCGTITDMLTDIKKDEETIQIIDR